MFDVLKTIFWALPRGLAVTLKYLFSRPTTVRYPEQKLTLSPRYRGLHYLERDADGSEKCVCCGLCAAACPSGCIYMEPAENEFGERYAKVYEINELRCIFCGYCQEACPKEAIFLGKEYEFSTDRREKLIYTKEDLLVPHDRGEKLIYPKKVPLVPHAKKEDRMMYLYVLTRDQPPTQELMQQALDGYRLKYGGNVRMLGGHRVKGRFPSEPDEYVVTTCLLLCKENHISFDSERDEITYSVDYFEGERIGMCKIHVRR